MTDRAGQTGSSSLKVRLQQWARPLGYALLGFAIFQWCGRSDSGPKPGESASEFSLTLANSPQDRVALADLRGNPAVIEVVASWCSACRSMAPTMADLARASRKRPVRFLAVAVDTPAQDAAALHQAWGIPFSIVIADDKFTSDNRIKVLPTIIVLDSDSRIDHVTSGGTRASTIDGWLEDLGAARM